MIKSFLCGTEEKEIKFLVYLDNEEGIIGIEEGGNGNGNGNGNGRKGMARKGKLLLEMWTLKFK